MKRKDLIPICVGEWEKGHQYCDGDPESDLDSERAPCPWRDRCFGFQRHLSRHRESRSAHLNLVQLSPRMKESTGFDETQKPKFGTTHDFSVFCKRAKASLSSPRQLRNFELRVACEDKTEGAKQTKSPGRRTQKERLSILRERRNKFSIFHEKFAKGLALAADPRRVSLKIRGFIFPGDLRLVLGPQPKLTADFYARMRSGADKILMRYRYMPDSGTVKVGFCVSVREFSSVISREQYLGVSPEATTSAVLPSCVPRVGLEQIEIMTVAFAALVEKGAIVLPE